jgi:hypothetical protein
MAYEDDDRNVQFNLKMIGKRYLMTWFTIDLIACIPIDWLIGALFSQSSKNDEGNANKLLRLARLPRLYRLVRIIRLLRLLKMGESLKKVFMILKVN